MYSKYWQQEFVTELPLSDFVKRVLNKRSKQVDQLGILAASSDAMQLHQFRIACKKLRYSAEMFGTLFGGSRHYLESLANLQQITGTLNDISVALGLLWQLESSERHETIILISGWLEHDYADSLMKLKKATQHYSEQPSFW
jgi:CHAD domain-containing protein